MIPVAGTKAGARPSLGHFSCGGTMGSVWALRLHVGQAPESQPGLIDSLPGTAEDRVSTLSLAGAHWKTNPKSLNFLDLP